jgi:hypothetical protein
MDPATAWAVATGALQVLQQTVNVLTGLYQYCRDFKKAPKLSKEVRMITAILEDLQAALQEIPESEKPQMSSKPLIKIVESEEFAKLMHEMASRTAIKEGEISYKRVKWPFTQKENEEYLKKLERYINMFQVVLQVIQRCFPHSLSLTCSRNSQSLKESIHDLHQIGLGMRYYRYVGS